MLAELIANGIRQVCELQIQSVVNVKSKNSNQAGPSKVARVFSSIRGMTVN